MHWNAKGQPQQCSSRLVFHKDKFNTQGAICSHCSSKEQVRHVERAGLFAGWICRKCDWNYGNLSFATYHMGDLSRKSALSIRNWVANKIVEGIKSTNRASFLKDLDFTHIVSCIIWNAAEPKIKEGGQQSCRTYAAGRH